MSETDSEISFSIPRTPRSSRSFTYPLTSLISGIRGTVRVRHASFILTYLTLYNSSVLRYPTFSGWSGDRKKKREVEFTDFRDSVDPLDLEEAASEHRGVLQVRNHHRESYSEYHRSNPLYCIEHDM